MGSIPPGSTIIPASSIRLAHRGADLARENTGSAGCPAGQYLQSRPTALVSTGHMSVARTVADAFPCSAKATPN